MQGNTMRTATDLQPVGNCLAVLRKEDPVVVIADINGVNLRAEAVITRIAPHGRVEIKLWKVHEGHPVFRRGQVITVSGDEIYR